MIELVTGKPGSGKSYFCIRKVYGVLSSGLWLAGNLELHDGWALGLARANPLWRALGHDYCERAAKKFEERTYLTHSLDELTRLRLPPCGKCAACKKDRRCMKEGRGVMILDEAHNWLNARTWDSDESGASLSKAEAVANRLKIVRFFSQHRKLGWRIYLITQDAAQLDNQVRRNFEYHTHLKNLRRLKVPLLGLPLAPFNVFVAVTVWHDSRGSVVGRDVFRLNRRLARWYSTTATSHGLDYDDPRAIWLGRPAPGRAAEGEAIGAGEASAAQPAASPPPGIPSAAAPDGGEQDTHEELIERPREVLSEPAARIPEHAS
jgi:hypothetical protein